MDSRILIAIIAAIAIVIVAVAVFYSRRYKSERLRKHFGPEYERVVLQQGDATLAEQVLAARTKRVEQFKIHSLPHSDRERYLEAWSRVQRQFVDDPRGAVMEAEALVTNVMSARGYPMESFEQRAQDISVHYPIVVQNYRAAHEIALRHSRNEASTEELRRAMVHYRTLFDELLETSKTSHREVA